MKLIKFMKELSWGTQVQGIYSKNESNENAIEFQGTAHELLSNPDFMMGYAEGNIKTARVNADYKDMHTGELISKPILHIILK